MKAEGGSSSDARPSVGTHYGVIAELVDKGKIEDEFTDRKTGRKFKKWVHKGAYVIQIQEKTKPPEDSNWEPRHKVGWLNFNNSTNPQSHIYKYWKKLTGQALQKGDDLESIAAYAKCTDPLRKEEKPWEGTPTPHGKGLHVSVDFVESDNGGVYIDSIRLDPEKRHTLTDYEPWWVRDAQRSAEADLPEKHPEPIEPGSDEDDIPF